MVVIKDEQDIRIINILGRIPDIRPSIEYLISGQFSVGCMITGRPDNRFVYPLLNISSIPSCN